MHTVYIVGAGPGDPGLLTVRAHKLLTQYAEVVVYDRLISDELLALIPESVERVYAGKSCKTHVMTQDEINAELVTQAQAGKKVVRLKGGDPFVFGRGGEEMLHLQAHDVPFEVVPGISAASGIAAKFGIPLTHRGVATSVRFITGHQQKGEPVVHDWASLANPECTLVIYMGLANLQQICDELMAHGLGAGTPAAIVQEGTFESERHAYSTLGELAALSKAQEFKPPCTIFIGKVVGVTVELRG